jgi:hypothetical protein
MSPCLPENLISGIIQEAHDLASAIRARIYPLPFGTEKTWECDLYEPEAHEEKEHDIWIEKVGL